MRSELPFVSVIIPTRPGQADIAAVEAVRALDYPRDRLEVLVARGNQPAMQRNAAVRAAQGDMVYFLDDDARPQPGNLRRALEQFARPDVQMVGGPNVCPPEAPPLEQLFAVVLSSWLAFGPSRARYTPVGGRRATSEKELILCNLAARRQPLLEVGGFDEALYPNEENALMDELQKRGGRLVYDPQFTAWRRPRPTLTAFCKMLFTYGRGRAEQFRLHPTFGSALNFVPPLLVVYLVLLPFLNSPSVVSRLAAMAAPSTIWLALNLPLVGYGLALVLQAAISAKHHGLGRALGAVPLVYAAHLFYGLGFWRGWLTRLGRRDGRTATEVTLDRITL